MESPGTYKFLLLHDFMRMLCLTSNNMFTVSAYVLHACGNESTINTSGIHYSLEGNSLFNIANKTGIVSLTTTLTNASRTPYQLRLIAQATWSNTTLNAMSNLSVAVQDNPRSSDLAEFEFQVSGTGFLEGPTTSNLTEFGTFISGVPGSTGHITARLGPMEASASFQVDVEPAVYVSAVLVEEDIWKSKPEVTVIAQVRDKSFSVVTSAGSNDVTIHMTPSQTIKNGDNGKQQVCFIF